MDQTQCVILVNTQQTPKRTEIEKMFTDHECRVVNFIPIFGEYDLCLVVSCQSTEQVAACNFACKQSWGWKTTTLTQAISADKFDSVTERASTTAREYAGSNRR